MLTYTGRHPNIYTMTVDDINLYDIIQGLSMENRYNGQSNYPYSVLQHSIEVAKLLPEKQKLAGLFHDGHEAYTKDLPWELKPALLEVYSPIANRIQDLINEKFGIKNIDYKLIKEVDNNIAWYEVRDIFSPGVIEEFERLNKNKINKDLNIKIHEKAWREVQWEFLGLFNILTKE